MRKRLIEKFTKCKEGSLGYTLTELLVVIGIIAIVCAIAIPSVVSISKSLRFTQRNDYAKSIFMAAQANLTEMRADGGLAPLQVGNLNSQPVREELCGFPVEDWSPEYVYTASDLSVDTEDNQRDTYALVLPVGSVDSALRDQHVIIEYNPLTGNVYSVFYCEDDMLTVSGQEDTLLGHYQAGRLPRNGEGDEKLRKDMMLGYYDGSGLSSAELEIERTEARITFENGEEGIVTVHVPMPDLYVGSLNEFMKRLEVTLTITGEQYGGKIENIPVKAIDNTDNCKLAVDGKTVEVTYVLDSLADRMSFANLSYNSGADAAMALNGEAISLTAVMDESSFWILPGENVKLDAIVTFHANDDRPQVAVQNATLGGVNPMFGYLTENLDSDPDNPKYTLTIENGRNLQNLNAIAPSVANQITAVAFTKDIYWNQTVAYYNQNYGTPTDPFESPADEAPARALPYFVPIHNENLFGTAKFIYPGEGDGGMGDFIEDMLDAFIGTNYNKIKTSTPFLTDEMDANAVNDNATISGGGHKVYNLNIDSTRYQIPNQNDANNAGKFYATGIMQEIDYNFTGLFGYVNTSIDNLHVVNPVIRGHYFNDIQKQVPVYKWKWVSDFLLIGHYEKVATGEVQNVLIYANPATGALVGAAGYNSLFTDCSAYIDTTDPSFDRSKMSQDNYSYTKNEDGTVTHGNQNWYGVSGEGAVGGLVGYAKSHRTTSGVLDGNEDHLAFSRCFAAVNVSGNMRGAKQKYFGYSNGIGGLVGNSEISNFYKCYASGNVRGTNTYIEETQAGATIDKIADLLGEQVDLYYNGRTCMGIGGFVGTSHGTRYTNCFASGNVTGTEPKGINTRGAGGFVGVMSYEETFAYGLDDANETSYAQHTVFENCYAVGVAFQNGVPHENFSGANARIKLNLVNSATYLVGNYYRGLAPYYCGKMPPYFVVGTYPSYETMYIFKDAYYLPQYPGTVQDNSNKCSMVESYDNLTKLHLVHRDERPFEEGGWIKTQIENIKGIYLYSLYEKVEDNWLFDKWDWVKHYYRDVYFEATPGLEGIYTQEYKKGFPAAIWDNIGAGTTHSYSLTGGNQAYPFTMIKDLPYYGNWPSRPAYAGIVYYEDYADKDNTTGYYFDGDNSSTLKNDQMIKSDGYAIISANADDKVTVRINDGESRTLMCDARQYKPLGISAVAAYSVFRIPSDMYDGLTNTESDSFYIKIDVEIETTTENGKETNDYTMYFNPFTAASQVVDANAAPTEAPTDVYIRTARQFYALSSKFMKCIWGNENVKITQQLNIDAATYEWTNIEGVPTLSTIGSAEHPFNATYTGTGGYVAQAQIKGFEFAAPLFANVGDKGAIRSLSIEVDGGDDGITIGKTTDDYTALVAAVCSGELENVDLTLTGSVTLNAKTAAGLLAGYISGTEADRAAVIGCDITADSLTVNAVNAGAVLGQAEYCDIRQGVDSENLADDLTLTLNNTLTLKGTDVGAYLGASGDLNGDKTIGEVNVDGLTITLKGITAEAQRLGALAGTLDTGSIKNLNVTLDNAYSVTHNTEKTVIAGVAAVAKDALVQSVTVNVNGTLTGDTAAGVFGTAENLTVQTTAVTVSGTITGTQAAAGMAASIEGGEFSGATVKLMNGTITANGTEQVTTEDTTAEDGTVIKGTTTTEPIGRAAGFAVEVHGQVATGLVIAETKSTITGNKEAAGFACEISAQVTGTRVAGNLAINGGKNAAGFAVKIAGTDLTINTNGVTPALENTAEGYKKAGSNNNLTVEGDTAALFAVEIGSGVNVRNCYVLGSVDGKTISGFADINGGTIDGCSANVTLDGGNAFVRENTGAISTSYGWYGDGSAENGTTTAAIETGSVVSSYFVDIDVPVTDSEDCKSVYIYYHAAYKGDNPEWITPLKLMEDTTLEKLNVEGGRNWLSGDSYGEYPYVKHIPAGYPYPQIRAHYGNWATPPRYAYGVLYFEKYQDEKNNVSWKLWIEELSLDGEATQTQTLNANDSFDHTGNIVQAGYALFFKGDTLENLMTVDKEALDGTIEIPSTELSNISGYSFVKLDDNKDIRIARKPVENDAEISVTVNTRYAHEFGTVDQHTIRTEDQLAQVAGSGDYIQTHYIEKATDFKTIGDFTGTYTGEDGVYIQKRGATNAWMNGVSGRVENLELVLGDLNTSFFGNVSGNVSLTQVSVDSLGANGRLVTNLTGTMTFTHEITADDLNPYHIQVGGQLSGMLIETVSGTLDCGVIQVGGDLTGKVIGTANADITDLSVEVQSISGTGAVIGTVEAKKTVSMSLTYSGDISGSIVDTVKGEFTLSNNPGFGTVSSSLFDTVSGTVTLSNGITVTTMANTGSLVGNFTGGANSIVDTGAVVVDTLSGSLVHTLNSGSVETDAITVTTLSGSLVNTVSGGTVSTGTIKVTTLNGALVQTMGAVDTNGNVTGSGTVNTGAITVTTLNASLVTTFNGGTMNGNNSQITVTNGITVPVFATELKSGAEVKNYVVSGNVTLGGNAKGALVNTNNGTLSGLTLRAASIDVTAADNTVGGLVGNNGTNGDITNCVVEGSRADTTAIVTITGEKGKSLTFGGLVGENSGDISGTTKVEADIKYIQPVNPGADQKDSATIGGLVGKMSGGTLNDATVSGSIDLTNDEQIKAAAAIAEAEAQGIELAEELNPAAVESNRSYIIGGAVGQDGDKTAKYTGVTTKVHVNDRWAVNGAVTYSMPAGRGAVGKFVGYVNNGVFTNCSANNANGLFMFLGEIKVNTKSTVALAGNDAANAVYGNTTLHTENQTVDSAMNTENFAGYQQYVGESHKDYYNYLATLDGCKFTIGTTEYTQEIDVDEYFYNQSNKTQMNSYVAILNKGGMTKVTQLPTYREMISTKGEGIATNYFVNVDGNFYRVYGDFDYWTIIIYTEYSWEFYYFTDDAKTNKVKLHDGTIKNNATWALGDLYLPSITIESGKEYLIVASGDALAVQNGKATSAALSNMDENGVFWDNSALYNARWKVVDGKYWQNAVATDKYVNPGRNRVIGNQSNLTLNYSFAESCVYDGTNAVKVTMKGDYWLTYGGSFGSNSSSGTAFELYNVSVGTDHYFRAVFALIYANNTPEQDQSCVAKDQKGNLLDFSTLIATSSESDLPGETGEATQGTEVPEATGSNETATVPPTAEDGNNN